LESLSHSAALAIKNARLYAEAKQRAEHLAVLHEVDQAITASLEIDQVYQVFAQQTLRLLPYDFMAILLVEGEMLWAAYSAGLDLPVPIGARLPLKTLGGSQWVIEQGQPLLSRDLTADPRFSAAQLAIAMNMNLRSMMILPLRIKGQIIGTWFLARRQVAGYTPKDLTIAQSLADQLAIALENARLFEQVQEYTVELEQRVADRTRELAALYEVAAVANESLDLPITLERSLERVLEAMRSQAGTIHLLNETGDSLHLAVQQNLPPDLTPQLETLPVGKGLPGWIIQSADPVIVPDIAMDPRSTEAARRSFQTYAGVPIRVRGRLLGVLSVVRAREQPPFKVEEVALLTTIADQVGVVVESARLRQLAEQSAVMAERARLARDLHDSVTQLLYSVNLFAAAGREAYQQGDLADVGDSLNELEFIAQQALKEMRLMVYELRPLALSQEGLLGAVQQRLEAVERRAGVEAQLQGNLTIDLPPVVEEALYHIIQEALNNALKHAAATAVTVRLETSGRQIEVEVMDNGSGFDPDALDSQGGLGLTSMSERVENLGGTLTLRSKPGEGTTVRVTLEVA
jgi:signal transduction histidine kinase